MTILDRICDDKRSHVAAIKQATPLGILEQAVAEQSAPRGFIAALRAKAASGRPGLIAEIKKASPSGGLIRADFDPAKLAAAYERAGAACLSILTDTPYFQGLDDHFIAARAACALPCIRKDFMVDPYQVVEARAIGADCILIIMAALGDDQAREIHDLATSLGMDVLVEVHDAAELDRATALNAAMIGVNNRNLKTMVVDLGTSERLAASMPSALLRVAESGIKTSDDIDRLTQAGFSGFLVGESLMRQPDLEAAVKNLIGPA